MLVATQGIFVCVLFVKISPWCLWCMLFGSKTRYRLLLSFTSRLFSNTVTFMWGLAYRLVLQLVSRALNTAWRLTSLQMFLFLPQAFWRPCLDFYLPVLQMNFLWNVPVVAFESALFRTFAETSWKASSIKKQHIMEISWWALLLFSLLDVSYLW